MNMDLRTKAKNGFEKYFLKLMNNLVIGKTMENVRKHQDIKLATTEKKKKLFGMQTKLSYNKVFLKNLLAIETEKTKIFLKKPVYEILKSVY